MEKVVCATPTPGKQPTRIDRWKYELIVAAILELVPTQEPGVAFRELPGLIAGRLDEETRGRLGSVTWYTTTVKLDLEVKGRLRRLEGSGPQRLVVSS